MTGEGICDSVHCCVVLQAALMACGYTVYPVTVGNHALLCVLGAGALLMTFARIFWPFSLSSLTLTQWPGWSSGKGCAVVKEMINLFGLLVSPDCLSAPRRSQTLTSSLGLAESLADEKFLSAVPLAGGSWGLKVLWYELYFAELSKFCKLGIGNRYRCQFSGISYLTNMHQACLWGRIWGDVILIATLYMYFFFFCLRVLFCWPPSCTDRHWAAQWERFGILGLTIQLTTLLLMGDGFTIWHCT